MSQQLRILQVEDSDSDAALVLRALEKSGYTVAVQRVETAAAMRAALSQQTWDVIICDYQLPQFDGRAALALLQSEGLDIPFIVVSGTIGQEVAVAMMRAGAHDYMMKDDLSRLGPAVARELTDALNRRQRRQAEERYRLLFDNALEGIYQSTVAGVIEMANSALAQLMGYASPAELKAHLAPDSYVNPEDRRRFVDLMATADKVEDFQYQAYRKDGSKIWISEYARALRNPQGEIIGYEGSLTDITQCKFTADTLLFLLQQAGAVSETEYYATVARYLSQTLEVDIVCLDRLVAGGQSAETLAFYCDGTMLPNITYPLDGTPCGTLLDKIPCVYPQRVQERFPRDTALCDLRVEGYIGIGLFASTGQQIGLIALLNHTPLAHPDLAEAVLQIVAVRVAGEMERRQTDRALRQAEAQQRLLLDNMNDYIARFNACGQVLYASGAAQRLTGYSIEELQVNTAGSWVHPDFAPQFQAFLSGLTAPESVPQTIEYPLRCKDGNYKWVEVTARKIADPTLTVPEYVAVIRDISQRKTTELALQQAEARNRMLLENMTDYIARLDQDTNVLFASGAVYNITGYTAEEIAVTNALGRVHPGDLNRVRDYVHMLQEPEVPPSAVEYRTRCKNGDYKWVEVIARKIVNPDTQAPEFVAIMRDISQRKQVEQALAESKENYQLLFDNINDAVFVLEYNWKDKQTGRFLVVNAVACERYGYTQEEFLTMRPQDIDDPAASALIPEALRKLAEDGYTVWEGLHHTKSGRIIPVEISNVLFDYHGQPTIMATVRDISERKQVEHKIMEITRRLQLATNAGRLGIWEWDITTNALIWDERMLELYGLTPATFTNVLESWIKCLHPDDCLTAQSVLHTAVASGCDYDSEFRVVHPDGTVRHLRAHAAIVLDPAGHPLRMVGFNQDITEQKQAQQALQLAKDAAERANTAKDEFLAKLSHELRTPLTPVLLAVADLEDEPGLSEHVRSDLAMIHRNIDLEAHLINDLLDVNRIMQGKLTLHRETLDLHQKIHDALSYVNRDLVKKQIKLTLQFNAPATEIDGDPARIQQIFWNLLSNAIKFTPEAGAISIRTSNTPDHQVMVEIADTGLGIKPEMLARLFEPFQQGEQHITRRFGGLGLGLTICKTLVDMHGGTIVATSAGPDQGATFTLRFPVVTLPVRAPAPQLSMPAADAATRPARRILFVEDHPDTALLVVRFLTHWGYKVDQVDTVAAALQHAEAGFDLLITDLGLPDGSGYDVMRKLSEKGPVKALVTSGFGMDIDQQRSRDAGFHAHLTKPVDFRELHGLLQKLLGT